MNKTAKVAFSVVLVLSLTFFSLLLIKLVNSNSMPVPLSVYSSADTQILPSTNANRNYGVASILSFDDGSGTEALINFDVSSIPANSTVTNATIYLYFSSANSQVKYAYPLSKSWNEGTGSATTNDATINGTTWNQRWFSTDSSSNWTAPGLGTSDYNATYVSTFLATSGGYNSIDVTDILNMTVNGKWVLNGWLLLNGNNQDQTFKSKETSGTSNDPYLVITYSLPSPIINLISPQNNFFQSSKTVNFTCNASLLGVTSQGNITSLRIDYYNSTTFGSSTLVGSQTFVDNFGSTECYQETATTSTACGGLDSGSYRASGTWTNGANTYDGNWGTFGSSTATPPTTSQYYVNYTKPSFAQGAVWEVSDKGGVRNLTVPAACFNYYSNTLALVYEAYDDASNNYNQYWCYDGVTHFAEFDGWNRIESSSAGGSLSYVYDEAIIWNMTVGSQTYSKNWSTTIANDGNYYWGCFVNASYMGTMYTLNDFYSTYYNLTIDSTAPNVTYQTPTPAQSSRQIGNSVSINVSVVDISPIDTCILQWNNTATITNYTMTKSGIYCNYTISTVDGTNYWFNVYANDSVGNLGNTSTRTFRENAKPTTPAITLTPASPYSNDTLTCAGSGSTDSDGDSLTYYYQFNFTNGTVIQDYQGIGYNYQENSNGGLCSGSWTGGTCASTTDGNWGSYSETFNNNIATVQMNYTKPTGALNTSLWQVKDDSDIANLTILQSCWNYDINFLFFQAISDRTAGLFVNGNGTWQCYNGTWNTLRDTGSASNGKWKIYEESLIWVSNNNTLNLNNYPSAVKGTNISCNSKAYDSYEYSLTNSTNVSIINYAPKIATWNISNSTWSTNTGTNINIYENATNGTYVFNVTNVTDADSLKGETFLYSWFVDSVGVLIGSANSFWNWILGSYSVGPSNAHNVTVYVNDTSNAKGSNYWNVTIYDTTAPAFSSLVNVPASPSTYPQATIFFNATMNDVHPQAVWIEFNGTNYTAEVTSLGKVYSFNRTSLSAGSYAYKWYGNDTTGNLGNSGAQTYNLNKATPAFNSSVTTPITYGTASDYSATESNAGDSDCTYNLYRNNVLIDSTTPYTDTSVLAAGSYTYILNTTGCTNYTSASDSKSLTINPASRTCTLSTDKLWTRNYDGTASSTTCTVDLGSTDGSMTFTRAGSGVSSPDLITNAGSYAYACQWGAGVNYSACTQQTNTLIINKIAGDVVLKLNSAEDNLTVAYPQQTNITSTTSYGTVTLYRDGTVITTQNGLNVTRSGGYYNITSVSSGDTNHNTATITRWLNITKASSQTSLTFDKTTPQTYGTAITPTCSIITGGTEALTLTNGTSGAPETLGANAWLLNCSYPGNTNYTASSNSSTFTIDKAVPSGSLTSSIGWIINESQSVTIGYSESNTGDADLTYKVYRDNVDKGSSDNWSTSYGSYSYILNTTGGQNYTFNASMNTQTLTVNDVASPSVSIVFPASDNLWFNYNNNVNYTSSDLHLQSCWWTKDSGGTNTTLANCGTNITGQTWGDGTITVTVYANDTSNNINSSTRIFKVDTTYPLISYGIGTQNSGVNLSQSFIYVNTSFTETNFANITFTLKNLTATVNTTTFTTPTYLINWTSLPDTDYTYYVNITDLANNMNSTSIYSIRLDTNAPSATPTFPNNNSYNSTTSQNFTANLTDNLGIRNATLYIYNQSGQYNVTNTNFVSNTVQSTLGIVVNLVDGVYKWWVKLWDWAGNSYSSQNNTLTIDTIKPLIYFNPTSDANGTWKQTGDIFINITTTDVNLNTVKLDFNGVNQSFSANSSDSYWINKTGLSEGTHTFYAWANDTASNYNITQLRKVYIDLENPTVTIISPADGFVYSTNVSILLNFTASDTNLQSCWWNLDNGANQSITCNTSATFNVSAASHVLYAYANDSSGRLGTTSSSFSINQGAPQFSINYYPTDNLWINYKNNIGFNYTVNGTGLDRCLLYTNSTGLWSVNQTHHPTGNVQDTFYLNLTDSSILWNIWCNNTANFTWLHSPNLTLNIDTIYPLISYGTGTENSNTNFSRNWIYVNVSVTELNEQNITFSLYNSSYSILNSSVYTNKQRNINWTLTDGVYYYNVTVIDKAGNLNSTETRKINLDTAPPTFAISEPQVSGSYTNNNSISLNYSVSDSGVGVGSCWYSIRNSSNYYYITNQIIPNCQNTTFGLPSGDIDYVLYFWTNDTLNNQNDQNFEFMIRTVSPEITLGAKDGSFFNRLTNIILNYTVQDTYETVDTCELWGNWTGTFLKNQTKTSISETSTNYFDAINLTEGNFLWNVWCNDSLGNGGFTFNRTFGTDITYPTLNITYPLTGSTVSTIFDMSYSIQDTNLDLTQMYFNLINSSGAWYFSPNQSLFFSSGIKSGIGVSSGNYNLYIWGTDKAGNMNNTYVTITVQSPTGSPGGGGGGLPPNVTVVQVTNNTFCGDTKTITDEGLHLTALGLPACQVDGNDAGIREDYFSCSQDCPPANIDTAIFGCFDNDPNTPCVWAQLSFQYIGLFIIMLGLVLAFSTTDYRGRQIPLYRYVYYNSTRKRRRR